MPELWLEREQDEVCRLVGAVTGGLNGFVASVSGETPQGRELDAELLLLPVRPSKGAQCGAIGSFAATMLPPWLGVDCIGALTTKTIRMIERSARPQIAFGTNSRAGAQKRPMGRDHLVVLPGGRS